MFISIRAIYVYFHSICSLVTGDKRIFSPGCAVTIVSIFLVALTKKNPHSLRVDLNVVIGMG